MAPARFVLLALLACRLESVSAAPNIIIAILDDYGWSSVGWHAKGQPNEAEVVTPNLDQLAAEGVILDRYYTFKFCSPSRSSTLTGRNPIHVNVINDDIGDYNLSDPVSGFSGIPRNMSSIAEKLASAGYSTGMAGKWHVGLATPDHTPYGRGFQSSLAYLDGANDYWSYTNAGEGYCSQEARAFTDLWSDTAPAYGRNDSWACSQSNQAAGCVYIDELFTNFTVDAINAQDPSSPLFFYFAPHNAHTPLEVPDEYLNKFAFINDSARQSYAAKVNYMDMSVGRIVDALKARGMWNNTLFVAVADNGGWILNSGAEGGNNWPLRGGKQGNFEGGIRVNAVVSGGFLPASRYGQVEEGLVAVEDWYATFCALAGADPVDHKGAAAGLPPVTSINMWPLLSGQNATSPRDEIIIGSALPYPGTSSGATFVQGLLRSDGYKLLRDQVGQAVWTGPFYPNTTSNWTDIPVQCGDPLTNASSACLFNVFDDPYEYNNIAASHVDIVTAMAARLAELQATVFSPNRGVPTTLSCNVSERVYRGFMGPFLP